MMLCRGLCQSIVGLKRAGVEIPEMHPRHLEHWFSNRFEDFYRVPQPSPMSLLSWKTQLGYFAKETPLKLIQTGNDSFTQVKTILTKVCSHSSPPPEYEIKSLRNLIKVSISNNIFLLGLNKILDLKIPGLGPFTQNERWVLKYNLTTHHIFPILSIVKVEEKSSIPFSLSEKKEETVPSSASSVEENKKPQSITSTTTVVTNGVQEASMTVTTSTKKSGNVGDESKIEIGKRKKIDFKVKKR